MGASAPDVDWIIGERYAVYDEIATGGMATVHWGRLRGPEGFARTVAIKRLHPHLARNQAFVSMFLDEARHSARVRHPNVVATLDVVADGGEVFLVMDFVLGESLARLLDALGGRDEAAPPAVVVGVMAGVLHGLHAAHQTHGDDGGPLGLVHRDVTPGNILVGLDGVARVLDFGIAKARALRDRDTSQGVLKGTIGFLAPEQIRGEPVDRRTDVYSAAVVLWEALAGRRLFRGDSTEEVLERIRAHEVTPPSAVRAGLPPELDRIVLKGLSRAAADRYATAREMALALEDAVPPPTPSHIGVWVESVAGAGLRERARRLAAIEARPEAEDGQSAAPLVPTAAPITGEPTRPGFRGAARRAAAAGADGLAPRPRPVAVALGIAGVALVAVTGIVGVFLASRPEPSGAAAPEAGVAAADRAAAAPCPLADATALTSGPAARHTCAVRHGGGVVCWGDNAQGQLGTGDLSTTALATPTQRLTRPRHLVAGNAETCAILEDGRVACWGKGLLLRPTAVVGLTDLVHAAVGGTHTCVRHQGGAVSCWGESARGQLGRAGPHAPYAVRVEGLADVTGLAAGTSHACAVAGAAGHVVCWGDNRFGQLGLGLTDREPHPRPARVLDLAGVVEVAAGDKTTFARTAAGQVYGWGFGVKRPVRVLLDDAVQVAAGGKQNCALRRSGTVWCWGLNDFGQLGAATGEDSAVPVAIAGLAGSTRLAVGDVHACALDRTGAVTCWGGNDAGQLGRGTRDRERHPDPAPVLRGDCR
jgi:serine/threonine-protein kinase